MADLFYVFKFIIDDESGARTDKGGLAFDRFLLERPLNLLLLLLFLEFLLLSGQLLFSWAL